ncbi:AAA family ATPase [Bacillus infantis]|uniref:AAA family ATPase n=1 Tax=Bacillus infantis TaxID=324767 RepID=UPI00209CD603|nr:AAA family ATPase [Bacillus infantis]MCP1159412.1 AAA family ATPase [Bacillus infantis]
MSQENIIELKLSPSKKRFYDDKSSFGIYLCKTKEAGKVMVDRKWDTFSIKGNTVELTLEKEYNAKLIERQDKQWGAWYEIVSIFEEIPKDSESQRVYLQTILTPNQVDAIFRAYPNTDIIELVQQGKFDVSKVHGVGEKSFLKIKKAIVENLEFQEAFTVLSQYGISNNLIIKLVRYYKSAGVLINTLKQTPYEITKVSGIGFKKADAIAMSMGNDPNGKDRIQSAIDFVLNDQANNGHTYCEIDKTAELVMELIGVNENLIYKYMEDTDDVKLVGENICLKKYYNAEARIAKRIKELLSKSTELNFNPEKFVVEQEEKREMTLTDQQKEFFFNIKKSNVNILTGYAGCVDMDTEFFNGFEWKRISEFKDGEMVLQYNEDGSTSLVEPIAYHKLPESKMTLIQNQSGSINQCLSDEHTVVYRTSKGNLAKLPFTEVAKRHNEHHYGFYGKFLTTFDFSGSGIDLSDEEIRVMVMVMADGYFRTNTSLCNVRIKKERKKERIRILLNNAKIPFNEKPIEDSFSLFTFTSPLRLKHYDSSWYQCSQHQLRIICDEVLNWDGTVDAKGRRQFSTNIRESADFIQFAFSATGQRATINIVDRVGQKYKNSDYIRKSVEYRVLISKDKFVSLLARRSTNKTKLVEIEPKDCFKYCFTLPSGMWLMRRGDRICVTGNCGKSAVTGLLIDLLEDLGISYRLLSPTGKAAKVLSGYTKRTAETIHRAIGQGREAKNDEDEIFIEEQFVIVDEHSMVDVFLCDKLLQKCRHKKLRLLFVGDPFQIPSVSAGNVLHDMLESKVIPTTKLDIVFRQKEGGIIDIATKLRLGQKFLKNSDVGIYEFGDNCIIASVPQEKVKGGYQYYFNKLLEKYKSEEVTVVTPTKKSELGTVEINKHIQEIVNGDKEKPQRKYGNDVVFREGDLVINTKNTYDVETERGRYVDIVNGDIGKVIKVDDEEEYLLIDFGFAVVPMGYDSLSNLLHAWGMTMHKMQGSSNKSVIAIADKAHKYQLNCNLLYTAVTRPEEYLVIVSQAETINFAMKKIANLQRNTFLKDMLMKGEEVTVD